MTQQQQLQLQALETILGAERIETVSDHLSDLMRFVAIEGECLTEEARQQYYWLLFLFQDFLIELKRAEVAPRFTCRN